jgi:hypothetical protein
MTGPLRGRRAAHRSCRIHGDNGCEIQGEAGPVTRALEKRRWKTEVEVDHHPGCEDKPVSSWEQRMSDRAKQRDRERRESEPVRRREEYERRNPDLPWLNGWRRVDLTTVSMGHPYCIGCGRLLGTACLVVEEGVEYPPTPEWPFTPDACPVCFGQDSPIEVYGSEDR